MTIDLQDPTLAKLLDEAARRGASQAITDLTLYTKEQACEMLGISYPTLQRRVKERKVREVDGRIPGDSIRAYLSEHSGNL